MPLELESLRNAIASLEEVLRRIGEPAYLSGQDEFGVRMFKAAAIQYFEVAYELSWKLIQRWVDSNVPGHESTMPRSRKDLFRIAARHGLLESPECWFGFGEARNKTSHLYSQQMAESVYEMAVLFLPEAKKLMTNLEKANA